MIYLLAVYLVYKGVEIFQIAFVASNDHPRRKVGVVIGILAVVGAICVGLGAVYVSEMQAESMQRNMQQSMPRF